MTIIERKRPNGWYIALNRDGSEATGYSWWVTETDDEDGVDFDEDESAARKYFAERVAELAETPNQEAQDRYDEEHGTINGYAPWQFEREY